MITRSNKLVRDLKKALDNGLPGTDVQWEMASSDRMIKGFPRYKSDDSRLGAVLILLYPSDGNIFTVFIQRPVYEGVHSGQIGFPGGKKDSSDRDLIETSIRETCEETGVCSDNIEIIGTLTPLYIPVSNIEVTPVLGYYDHKPEFNPSSNEVLFIIEARLSKFSDKKILKEMLMNIQNENLMVKYFDYNNHVIWGATAMILYEFMVIIERENINLRV